MNYTIGVDYGTNSVRAVVVDVADGAVVSQSEWAYSSGHDGILLDGDDHHLARQRPEDYLEGLERSVREALLKAAKLRPNFTADNVVGLGVDTTGSTPIPLDRHAVPLCFSEAFRDNLNACSWLWKDHTAYAEAEEITELARKLHPEYLEFCGGVYSSEWFFSKIFHCLRVDRTVFDAAYTWVECCDYLPAVLCGVDDANLIVRSRCAAGHKAMFNENWGGYPSAEFLGMLDPKLAAIRSTLPDKTVSVNCSAGTLSEHWAAELGLPVGIPVAAGALDAHMGAIGSGVGRGKLVKIIGTSSCDIMVAEKGQQPFQIAGLCGIVDGSVLPGYWGFEAGQSAVGDIFNWFVDVICPGGKEASRHAVLTEQAACLRPGQSGLLALDWNNGNRCLLVDQRLTGLILGQTLHTTAAEIYRALIEATAFGALAIINRLQDSGVQIEQIIACGGIAEKNSLLMQIYADVTGMTIDLSGTNQACALGSAISAAVVAGCHEGIEDAQKAMCAATQKRFSPDEKRHQTYQSLFELYLQLHDSFGLKGNAVDLSGVMKKLLAMKSCS